MEYDFSAGRSGRVSLVGSTNCVAIDVRVGGSAHFESHPVRYWDGLSLFN